MSQKSRIAQRAHTAVNDAIRRGKLVRPEICQDCKQPGHQFKDGRAAIQAHHHKGYDHPLDVMWLCMQCHVKYDPRVNGERHGCALLTSNEVKQIRMLASQANEPASELAKKFGVAHVTVNHILSRRNWKHIE